LTLESGGMCYRGELDSPPAYQESVRLHSLESRSQSTSPFNERYGKVYGTIRGTAASASYAAPSRGADSFKTTDTGMLSRRLSNFHLSRNALKNFPSLIFSMILTAMPPATYKPPSARTFRARFPASAP